MNRNWWRKHKAIIWLQSQALVFSMAALLGWVGWLLGGQVLAFIAVGATIFLYYVNPVLSPAVMLRAHRARRLHPHEAPRLYAIINMLADRAGLSAKPSLYLHPGNLMSAFTVGTRSQAVIAVSRSLLQNLDQRETAAVLAHEVSHIRDNDIRIMGFAASVGRLTAMLSLFGQMLLILNLPLLLFGGYAVSWTVIVLLITAPTVSTLLQLALSRTREFKADLGAVELTGDPDALAAALAKLDYSQQSFLKQLIFPMSRWQPESSIWRTHPPTPERVRRILGMRENMYHIQWQRNPAYNL